MSGAPTTFGVVGALLSSLAKKKGGGRSRPTRILGTAAQARAVSRGMVEVHTS